MLKEFEKIECGVLSLKNFLDYVEGEDIHTETYLKLFKEALDKNKKELILKSRDTSFLLKLCREEGFSIVSQLTTKKLILDESATLSTIKKLLKKGPVVIEVHGFFNLPVHVTLILKIEGEVATLHDPVSDELRQIPLDKFIKEKNIVIGVK